MKARRSQLATDFLSSRKGHSMANIRFMRWENSDATADLICLCCFRTLAHSRHQNDLLAAEDDHICNPLDDLAFLHSDALKGPHGQERSSMPSEDCRAD